MTTVPVYWYAGDEASLPAGDDWLTAHEQATLATLRVARRRSDWRLGRWTAKQALAAVLSLPGDAAASVEIRAAPDGAPDAFVRGEQAPVTISLTHRAGRAVCAVAARPAALGCDLERIEARSARFVADYFTPPEQALVACARQDDRQLWANLIWSAKECALKALRVGLRLDTRAVEVTVPDPPAAGSWHPFVVRYAAGDRTFTGWWRRLDDHLLTLAGDPPLTLPRALHPG